jgi:hypothetical protein
MNLDRAEKASFGGHETFPFRFAWLPKAVRYAAEDPQVFGKDDAIVRLGVGKNMVRSMRHWGVSMGVLAEVPQTRGREVRPTSLGTKLFHPARGADRYLEDVGTLWLLHWHLASNPVLATTWHWVFNHAPQLEFTRKDLLTWIGTFAEQKGWTRVAETSLKRDIDTFLRTYVPSRVGRATSIEDSIDCPLSELGLLRQLETGEGAFELSRGAQPSLPDEVFAYALAQQLASFGAGSRTVPLHSLAFAPGSPGRVFCLAENALLSRLERIASLTDHAIVFDETAGLRQILVKAAPDTDAMIDRYYRRTGGRA